MADSLLTDAEQRSIAQAILEPQATTVDGTSVTNRSISGELDALLHMGFGGKRTFKRVPVRGPGIVRIDKRP